MLRRPALILTSLVVIIIALAITRIVVSNSIATNGVELVQLQQQIKDLDTQNLAIKEKIYTIASLEYVAEKAKQMGFVDDKTTYVVSGPQTIAQTQ